MLTREEALRLYTAGSAWFSQEEGVNLAGIKRIIELTNQVDALRSRVSELGEEVAELRRRSGSSARAGGELVHVPRSTSVVVTVAGSASSPRLRCHRCSASAVMTDPSENSTS